ncbi:hypothetical protein EXS71_02070 [Candidatus Uhrbacteria bacterium]|nr:hypothetical protein [Candidatus Uhrbacteria bacterium]
MTIMAKLIIGLVGQAGCGKGTATDILREQYGAGYYRFSAILENILDQLALDHTRENFTKLSEISRQTFGEDVLSYALEKQAVTAQEDVVIVDGIRRLEDLAALEPLPHFKLIAIEVPVEVRYQRVIGRGEKAGEKNMTMKEFLEQEKFPTEVTIPAVMKRATKTISNAGTRKEFEKEIHDMMKEFGFSKH